MPAAFRKDRLRSAKIELWIRLGAVRFILKKMRPV